MLTAAYHLQDIPPAQGAKVVADQMECEDMCTATEGCNAASYYNEAVAGFNCWLKIIDDVCEVPSDALDDPNATLLLKFDDACAHPPSAFTHIHFCSRSRTLPAHWEVSSHHVNFVKCMPCKLMQCN